MTKMHDENAETGQLPLIVLGKNEERRIRAGHLWVYANEIDKTRSPLKSFAAGDLVDIVSARQKWIGRGYVNPAALIAARIVTRSSRQKIDETLISSRIADALCLRERFYPEACYRLIYAESDRMPGLVVDRYRDVFVVQANTAGSDRLLSMICDGLVTAFNPTSIVARNDSSSRELEGLKTGVEVLHGSQPSDLRIVEGDCQFDIDVMTGQKTGWYFDQSINRDWLARHSKDQSVLDVCSYIGAWSIRALSGGADRALCIDSSDKALERARHNAKLNGFDTKLETRRGDALQTLKALDSEGRKFDTVVVDPPAFIRRKKSTRDGLTAYQKLNEAALALIKSDGLLVTCSCSYHASRDDFHNAIRRAGIARGRNLQLIHEGHQGPDHPVHPAMPETAYLKCQIFRVL